MRPSSVSRLTPLAAVLSGLLAVHAATVKKTLTIVNTQLAPDGFQRSTVVADGTFPGPLITANKGDNLQINVVDKLTDDTMLRATSIHWHGLFQAGTNEMDGPAFVTQCPIVPNDSFLYNFAVPGQSGTFWYHSHYSTQYCDGLRGALVLYDPFDPLKYLYDIDDASTVITLADWYHGESTQIFPNTNAAVPTPDSALINGKGRFNGSTTPLAVVSVHPGKRHRLRIVSTSCFSPFNFSIDGHSLTIIETDGQETQPHTVDFINIFAAQRYSVILTANQPVGNYWIRAVATPGPAGFAGGINSAILRYNGAPVADPTSSLNTGAILSEADLKSLIDPRAPGKPQPGGGDVNYQLTLGRNAATGRFTVNNVSFVPPNVPVLLQILSGTTPANQLLPAGSIYPLPKNKVIEINIPGGGNHPFHLHGHAFSVVRSAGSNVTNYVNPVKRDVVSIGNPGDNVTFRFVTDNPGPWFLHCHIDWHLEAGLAIVFAEDVPDVAKANAPIPKSWKDLCPTYNVSNPDTAFLG